MQVAVKHHDDEDGGCFRAPDPLVDVKDSIILEPFAKAPIVDTTNEYFESMLEDVLAKHGVYTSDLKSDILHWQQQQVSIYSMTFRF